MWSYILAVLEMSNSDAFIVCCFNTKPHPARVHTRQSLGLSQTNRKENITHGKKCTENETTCKTNVICTFIYVIYLWWFRYDSLQADRYEAIDIHRCSECLVIISIEFWIFEFFFTFDIECKLILHGILADSPANRMVHRNKRHLWQAHHKLNRFAVRWKSV